MPPKRVNVFVKGCILKPFAIESKEPDGQFEKGAYFTPLMRPTTRARFMVVRPYGVCEESAGPQYYIQTVSIASHLAMSIPDSIFQVWGRGSMPCGDIG